MVYEFGSPAMWIVWYFFRCGRQLTLHPPPRCYRKGNDGHPSNNSAFSAPSSSLLRGYAFQLPLRRKWGNAKHLGADQGFRRCNFQLPFHRCAQLRLRLPSTVASTASSCAEPKPRYRKSKPLSLHQAENEDAMSYPYTHRVIIVPAAFQQFAQGLCEAAAEVTQVKDVHHGLIRRRH